MSLRPGKRSDDGYICLYTFFFIKGSRARTWAYDRLHTDVSSFACNGRLHASKLACVTNVSVVCFLLFAHRNARHAGSVQAGVIERSWNHDASYFQKWTRISEDYDNAIENAYKMELLSLNRRKTLGHCCTKTLECLAPQVINVDVKLDGV